MPPAEPRADARPRPLDTRALAHVKRRLNAAPQPPWLHGEVARRMAERLSWIKRQPECVVDWGRFLGASREVLAGACPQAQVWAVEPDAQARARLAAAAAAPWWSPRRWAAGVQVVDDEGVAAGQAQMVWANMGLHGEADPVALMRRWQRLLAVDGFLMFSTLGPGTLGRLRALYARRGWPAPMAPFVDMHDLGDMLVETGFADPVMDQESITLTWPSADALLRELRGLGGNVSLQRPAGLRTPRWRADLMAELAGLAGPDGRIALDFEIVYGHAFRAAPRVAGQVTVSVDELRAMARQRRSPR